MLNKTETENHRLFCRIFIIGVISIEGEPGPLPWLRLCLSAGIGSGYRWCIFVVGGISIGGPSPRPP